MGGFGWVDRRVLVTGAAGGIGAAAVGVFREAGARVLATDRGELDVTDPAAVEATCAAFAPTDIVHAAGIVAVGEVAGQVLTAFRHVIEVNLVGSFLVGQAAARHLPPGGTLTFVSSQAGFKGGRAWAAYAASKAGVNRLVDALAEELAPRVRVNAVCPGNVETAASAEAIRHLAALRGASADAVRARYVGAIPVGRFARPEEVAQACLWLASPAASYLTGVLLPVDGGELSR